MRLFIILFLLTITSCGPNSPNSDNTPSNTNEFAQRNVTCLALDQKQCFENDLCEWVSETCIAKPPTPFAIVPVVESLAKELVGRQITAMAKGPLASHVYVGTDDGLVIWGGPKQVEKIQDFSGGNPALAGIKYVRAIVSNSVLQRGYAAIGKNGDANDPDSKIVYEITQKTTLAFATALNFAHGFETTPGMIVFGGVTESYYKEFANNTFNDLNLAGITTGVFNPNGSNVWFGTGGPDTTKHVGIKFYDASLAAVVTGKDSEIKPSTWGSTAAAPNSDISSMVLFNDYILIGLRAKKNDPNSGGVVAISIYEADKTDARKPFLLGTDVKKIIVGDFNQDGPQSVSKKKLITIATSNGIYAANFKSNFVNREISLTTTPINKDRQGALVNLKEIDHLFQQSSGTLWFSSNNELYFVDVR